MRSKDINEHLLEMENHLNKTLEQTSDSDFNKDIRENSGRDAVIAEMNAAVDTLEIYKNIVEKSKKQTLPGTIGIDTVFRIVYKKIVVRGEEKSMPLINTTFYAKLHPTLDIGDIPSGSYSKEEPYLIPLTSSLGDSIFGKAPGVLKIPNGEGFIEVEIKA